MVQCINCSPSNRRQLVVRYLEGLRAIVCFGLIQKGSRVVQSAESNVEADQRLFGQNAVSFTNLDCRKQALVGGLGDIDSARFGWHVLVIGAAVCGEEQRVEYKEAACHPRREVSYVPTC